MADETVKVVQAEICKVCETVIKEEVKKISLSYALLKKETTPDTFFEYKDKIHNAAYRSISSVPCCGRC